MRADQGDLVHGNNCNSSDDWSGAKASLTKYFRVQPARSSSEGRDSRNLSDLMKPLDGIQSPHEPVSNDLGGSKLFKGSYSPLSSLSPLNAFSCQQGQVEDLWQKSVRTPANGGDQTLTERDNDLNRNAKSKLDEHDLYRSSTPIQFSTARPAACKQNDGSRGVILAEFDKPANFACGSKVVASASGLRFIDPSAPNKNKSPSPDKVSQSIFKTRRCPSNSLLKQKRRRRSSQKNQDEVASTLFTFQDSTKISNLIADLDQTMNFLVPKSAQPCSDASNIQNASLQFFQISLLHPSKQFANRDLGTYREVVDAVAHNDAMQLFASKAIE